MADYKIIKLIRNGIEYKTAEPYHIEYVAVGGGGGGGTYYSGMFGGGGGGGEVKVGCLDVGATTNIGIGVGGYGGCQSGGLQCGQKGLDTHLGMITAHGGYGGGCCTGCGGMSGSGCAGGGCYSGYAGGGGGGALCNGCCTNNRYCGGVGGAGICGYGGGGSGGGCACCIAGVDGGGYGQRCMGGNGVNGGGGGGAYQGTGGNGGDGLVVICYKTDGSCGFSCATGGTITTSGEYTVHCFTSDGTFCILS